MGAPANEGRAGIDGIVVPGLNPQAGEPSAGGHPFGQCPQTWRYGWTVRGGGFFRASSTDSQ